MWKCKGLPLAQAQWKIWKHKVLAYQTQGSYSVATDSLQTLLLLYLHFTGCQQKYPHSIISHQNAIFRVFERSTELSISWKRTIRTVIVLSTPWSNIEGDCRNTSILNEMFSLETRRINSPLASGLAQIELKEECGTCCLVHFPYVCISHPVKTLFNGKGISLVDVASFFVLNNMQMCNPKSHYAYKHF